MQNGCDPVPEGHPATFTATTSDVAGRGVGSSTATVEVDTASPSAIAAITPSVKDRRQTSFISLAAPADDAGRTVGGYEVRVSKSPLNAGNFASGELVPFTGVAQAPGVTDGIDIADRLIENDYYFGVVAIDKAGNRSAPIFAGPTRAQFSRLELHAATTNEQFGYSVDGSSDLNGDQYTDLVVGSQNGKTVYIYWGSATGYSDTNRAAIEGTAIGFGFSVAVVGDIDGDQKDDLAVGSINTGKVFIFAGGTSWATEADAKYVVSDGGGNFLGVSLARLGDFDGDGFPDFAVGASTFNSRAGRISIIRGVPQGTAFGATVTLPDAYGMLLNSKPRAMHIDGPAAGARLGFSIIGLGSFYSGGGTSLAALAPSQGNGYVYAFAGNSGDATGTIALGAAAHNYSIPAGTGRGSLHLLGKLTNTKTGIGFGAPSWTAANGYGYVALGDASNGVFQSVSRITNSAATAVNDGFAQSVFGGGFSGVSAVPSLIGGTDPDVGLCGAMENASVGKLYLYTGAHAWRSRPSPTSSAQPTCHGPSKSTAEKRRGSGALAEVARSGYEWGRLRRYRPGRIQFCHRHLRWSHAGPVLTSQPRGRKREREIIPEIPFARREGCPGVCRMSRRVSTTRSNPRFIARLRAMWVPLVVARDLSARRRTKGPHYQRTTSEPHRRARRCVLRLTAPVLPIAARTRDATRRKRRPAGAKPIPR